SLWRRPWSAVGGLVPNPTDIMSSEQLAALRLLQGADKQIEAGQGVPKDLDEQVFGGFPLFREFWPRLKQKAKLMSEESYERFVEKMARTTGTSVKVASEALNQDRADFVSSVLVRSAMQFIEILARTVYDSVLDLKGEREAIPSREALDRLLRYETTFDRALNRSLDRLERLQRRRRGE